MRIDAKILKLADVTIRLDAIEDGARAVIAAIRPDWLRCSTNGNASSSSGLRIKHLTDGLTNRLLRIEPCFDLNGNSQTEPETETNSNEPEQILIRVYGENTELFIDREAELRNMQHMFGAGLSAPVYCAFRNGLAYGYTAGEVLDCERIRVPEIAELVARQMAAMHRSLPMLDSKLDSELCLFKGLNRFLSLLPRSKVTQRDQLATEIRFLTTILPPLDSPIVFCHNDLLMKNIVYDKVRHSISFIDFEYSDYNYQAFDIANHFLEHCGVDQFDATRYPDRSYQLWWLTIYDTRFNRGDSTCLPQDRIERLYDRVQIFALAPLLYWSIWGMVQAENSTIDFDYHRFTADRLADYYRRKNILFA